MSLIELISRCRESTDFQPLIDQIPYSAFIGMNCEQMGEELIFKMPKNEENLGNPMLPAIHGGVIGGFLENSAVLHLLLKMETPQLPKTINFSMDFLRAGRHMDTFARCEITRQGRRAAHVNISAWQTRESEPIAVARAHFLLTDRDAGTA